MFQFERTCAVWIACMSLCLASVAFAETDKGADAKMAAEMPDKDATAAAKKPAPLFVPRDLGSPVTRVGGATRGIETEPLPRIAALVPEHVGYTLLASPTLYWHLSDATEHRVDFTLLEESAVEPVIEATLEGPFSAGIQAVSLADRGFELNPGVTYLWYVSLVSDPERRGDDKMAGGAVSRLASEDVAAKLAAAPADQRVFVLAEEGVWYDAVDALSQQAGPEADAQRDALLAQVGLAAVSGN